MWASGIGMASTIMIPGTGMGITMVGVMIIGIITIMIPITMEVAAAVSMMMEVMLP